jgi:hypothetical protein
MGNLNTVAIKWDEQDRPLITITYRDGETPSTQANVDEALTELADRLQDKSARFLRELIRLNEAKGAVSLAELADELGDDVAKKDVDGWNRNLGRSIKAVVREFGFLRSDAEDGTAQLFDFEWDESNHQWLYVVPTRFRGPLTRALEAE